MKYKVTLKSVSEYEVEAESEEEAKRIILFNPMYRPDAIIVEISDKNTINCEVAE